MTSRDHNLQPGRDEPGVLTALLPPFITILCPSLTSPTSGSIVLSTSGTQTTVNYTCASGYNLNGSSQRLCYSNGSWSLVDPTCTCESPSDPLNGVVADDGATARYTCYLGYSMDGQPTRACGTDGTGWSGTAPTCSTCDTLTSPIGGSVGLNTDGINTVAAYSCENGYTVSGVSDITCRSDGTWNFTSPNCAKCSNVSDPDSGSLEMTTTGLVTTATFSCQSGYYLKGQYSISCGTDANWSDDAPTCKCNFPAQPQHGKVSLSETGNVATYTCDTEYSLDGLSARTCQSDDTGWEGAEPSCTTCLPISTPSSGSSNFASNGTHTTVHFTCDVGTTIDGINAIMCTADGTWESLPPTCVSCPSLSNPDSGSVLLSTDGSSTTATFSCVTDYTISSTNVLTCMPSGAWDLSLPYCYCIAPPSISNGDLAISNYQRTATYTCNIGYVLVGSDSRICQNSSIGWNGQSPICDTVTPPCDDTDASTWNIPVAVVVFTVLLFVVLLIALAGIFLLYYRLRKEKSRVDSEMSLESEEMKIPVEISPDVFPEPKPTADKATLHKKCQSKGTRALASLTTSKVIFPNGITSPNIPKLIKGRVQLPPIEHVFTEMPNKSTSARTSEKKRTRVKHQGHLRNKNQSKDRMDEVGIERTKTPDLLYADEFNYIHPVYSYALEAPSDTGREIGLSRTGKIITSKKKKKHNRQIDNNPQL